MKSQAVDVDCFMDILSMSSSNPETLIILKIVTEAVCSEIELG